MRTKTYATFGVSRSFRQFLHAMRSRRDASQNMALLFMQVKEHERRIERKLGRPMSGLRILEIGPGQGMERAQYFGIKNQVLGIDLDVIPTHMNIRDYVTVLRKNGMGRLLKSMGRRLTIGRKNERSWEQVVGNGKLPYPQLLQGDICRGLPDIGSFDVIVSWSVFEHLPNPAAALKNVKQLLRPNGVFLISLHLFTSNNGHHDIRAFTGDLNKLPLWGHLRPSTRKMIQPSSYLNEWRLGEWRDLFLDLAPGHQEILRIDDHREEYLSRMDHTLREELLPYTEEELFSVDVIYLWKKPRVN